MAKSMVEKYEQILADDPGSMVFVELAKALIDRGEHQRAVEVCQRGIEHHPESVVGRVLWGKALISSGRPAEAMEQFDQAMAVEKDNPYAYNLIGEVLLHKGLYRSALPILKKAVALQPADNRVRQWLDQAQRALSGQQPEAVRDSTTVDAHPPGAASDGLDETKPQTVLPDGSAPDETLPNVKALAPEPEPETVGGMTDVFKSLAARDDTRPDHKALVEVPEGSRETVEVPVVGAPPAAAPPVLAPARPVEKMAPPVLAPAKPAPPPAPAPTADPFVAAGGAEAPASDVVPGLTGVFDSLAKRDEGPDDESADADQDGPAAAPEPPQGRNTPTQPELPATGGGLLGDLPAPAEPQSAPAPTPTPPPLRRVSEPNVQISPELLGAPPLPRGAPPLPKRPGLLGDLPELHQPPEPRRSDEVQKIEVAPEAAEDIAREYERELREKLLATPPPTFWRKHWLKLSVGAVAALALLTALAIYSGTRRQNRGADLASLRSKSWQALTLDTPFGYRAAEEMSLQARAISEKDASALAAAGYANARLFALSGEPARKAEAQKLLPGFREKHAGLAAASALLVSDDKETALRELEAVDVAKLGEGFERAAVHATLAEQLLAQGEVEKALAALEKAKDADAGNVRVLVALGSHFLRQDEPEQAAKFFDRARSASPEHVPALVALLNARLALELEGYDPAPELAELKKAWDTARQKERAWPAPWEADLALLEGRVLARAGKRVEAVTLLGNGASRWRERAGEFYAALGAAEASAGNFDKAEKAYEDALKHSSAPAGVVEELCRVLIARGSLAEALKRAQSGADPRRLALIRGIARFEQGELAKARDELNATRRDGKVPLEAAVYLATIDALQGQRETARAVLDTAARKTGRIRAAALVGLGRMYQANGRRVEAIAAYQDAGKEPGDWEGPCSLGRLYLSEANFDGARASFELALSRNAFHHDARVGLGHTLLSLGDAEGARKEFAAVIAEDRDASAHRGMARALLATANVAQARRHAARAAKLEPRSPDNARLFGQIALASGDAQGAIRSLEKQLAAEPANPDLLCDLGEVQLKLGNVDRAKEAFDAALKSDKEHLRARLGTVHVALPEKARSVLKLSDELVKQTASAPAPLRARALALQSRVQLSLKREEKARELADQAVAAFDGSADAHFALALAAKAQRDAALGQNELQRVVALDPSFAEAHLSLAESLAQDPESRGRAMNELKAYLRIAPKGPYAPIARKALAALKKRR